MESDEAKVITFIITAIVIVILGYNLIYSNPSPEEIKKELIIACLDSYRNSGSGGLNQQVTPEVINTCTESSIKLLSSKGPV